MRPGCFPLLRCEQFYKFLRRWAPELSEDLDLLTKLEKQGFEQIDSDDGEFFNISAVCWGSPVNYCKYPAIHIHYGFKRSSPVKTVQYIREILPGLTRFFLFVRYLGAGRAGRRLGKGGTQGRPWLSSAERCTCKYRFPVNTSDMHRPSTANIYG